MDFTVSKFDMKSFARKLNKTPKAREPEERDIYQEYVRLQDLKECFYKMYSDLQKHDAINIREVDFGSFEDYELEDFYSFLEKYDHGLFDFGVTMLSFKPAVTTKPVFI